MKKQFFEACKKDIKNVVFGICLKFFKMKKIKKRGQLGIIEFKYFIVGFFIGIITSLVLVLLGTKNVLPFKIPFVCGSALFSKNFRKNKKGQLAMIEFQYAMVGFGIGIVVGLVLVWLGSAGILPFKIPLVC